MFLLKIFIIPDEPPLSGQLHVTSIKRPLVGGPRVTRLWRLNCIYSWDHSFAHDELKCYVVFSAQQCVGVAVVQSSSIWSGIHLGPHVFTHGMYWTAWQASEGEGEEEGRRGRGRGREEEKKGEGNALFSPSPPPLPPPFVPPYFHQSMY